MDRLCQLNCGRGEMIMNDLSVFMIENGINVCMAQELYKWQGYIKGVPLQFRVVSSKKAINQQS